MFENIRKCLDKYEDACNRNSMDMLVKGTEDYDICEYIHMNFAQAIMKDFHFGDDEKIAKIILAVKGLSNEIKIKVE